MKNIVLYSILFYFTISNAFTQRIATASRISTKIQIDGSLNEQAWKSAESLDQFTQYEPIVGNKPSHKSDVRILYDDNGLYIGAYLYQDKSTILHELSLRDQKNNTDWFGVTLDCYQGGLNGWAFIVTAAGVQQDLQFSGTSEDVSWDAVWKSAVSLRDDGWVVEMLIPYYAIRFPNKEIQHWNLQIGRDIRYLREQSFWQPIDPTINGFINQCGILEGIRGIRTPVRLSLTPYISGYINHDSTVDSKSPTTTSYNMGMDLKYGINDAFTLDMTLIPDFGQVISDNLIVNLGPFEQFFQENRSFFTEGIDLFNKGNLFYTRRIGGVPLHYFEIQNQLNEDEIIVKNNIKTQLINATKISGRTSSGMGMGFFNAIVKDEKAIIHNTKTGEKREIQSNPTTNYNVMVFDQNLPNNSVVTLINTNVRRFGNDYDANVTGGLFDIKNKNQQYGVSGKLVVSQKYFEDQRDDIGHSYQISGGKIGGKFRSTISYIVETENYDINDAGILFSPNEKTIWLNMSYEEYKPKNKKLLRWNIYLSPVYERLYKPNVFTNLAFSGGGFLLFKSRFGTGINFTIEPIETFDYFEPRTSDFSIYYTFPKNWRIHGFISTDYRKIFAVDIRMSYRKFDEENRNNWITDVLPRIRLSNKFSIFGNFSIGKFSNDIGYINAANIDTYIDNLTEGDIVFGRRNRIIYDNSIRLNYIFSSTMSLSLRARHYWDQFVYNRFSRLLLDGSLSTLEYDGSDNEGMKIFDANTNIFNVDLFYTWRFAPGSDLILGWKNSIFSSNSNLDSGYFENLTNTLHADQLNNFSLRIIYFFDYNTTFKK